MESSQLRLQQIVNQLSPQQVDEVVDFAEFLSFKAQNGPPAANQNRKRLNLPVIKNVKFVGDPLLRREDLYDDRGR